MNAEEFDIGKFTKVKILAGSHNQIIIEKLYGPTISDDINIVWEKDGWNIISKQRVREAINKAFEPTPSSPSVRKKKLLELLELGVDDNDK
jgi:hypothetical protein